MTGNDYWGVEYEVILFYVPLALLLLVQFQKKAQSRESTPEAIRQQTETDAIWKYLREDVLHEALPGKPARRE